MTPVISVDFWKANSARFDFKHDRIVIPAAEDAPEIHLPFTTSGASPKDTLANSSTATVQQVEPADMLKFCRLQQCSTQWSRPRCSLHTPPWTLSSHQVRSWSTPCPSYCQKGPALGELHSTSALEVTGLLIITCDLAETPDGELDTGTHIHEEGGHADLTKSHSIPSTSTIDMSAVPDTIARPTYDSGMNIM